jgi:methionine sulfoxide reductase heme-binding subunit
MEIHSIFAHISWLLLILILCMRPLVDISENVALRSLLGYRKHLGILCGCAAIMHVVVYLITYDLLVIYIIDASFWQLNNLFGWGNLSLITLLIPFLTSNRRSQRFFKKRWKTLQKFSYLAIILTAIHIAFARQELLYATVPLFMWLVLWFFAYRKNHKKKMAP